MTAPLFSVIVPTFDRPLQLRACLEGLSRQTLPASAFEVLVVDDAGTADEAGVIGDWPELEVTLLREDRGGPGAARNLGATRARGRFLAFIDDDCVPDPEWLEGLDRSALKRGAVVGGTIENALPSNPYSTATQLITSFVYRYHDEDEGRERFFTTNNLALPREAFEALGGFDTSIPAGTAEDKDLCDRWRAGGGELVRAPAARVGHAHHLGLGSFVRQHFRYGRGILCFRVLRRRRHREGPAPIRPEPWSFYMRLIAFPFQEVGGLRGLRGCGLAALAQFATALGCLYAVVFDLRRTRPPASG